MRRFYTTYEAGHLLGVSLPTVVNWIEARRLKAHRTPGGHRRIARERSGGIHVPTRWAEVHALGAAGLASLFSGWIGRGWQTEKHDARLTAAVERLHRLGRTPGPRHIEALALESLDRRVGRAEVIIHDEHLGRLHDGDLGGPM